MRSEKDINGCFNARVFQCIGLVAWQALVDDALSTEARSIRNSLDSGTVDAIRLVSKTG